jgi:prephenate dehydratase
VAFQGELGAFSELAVAEACGREAIAIPYREFADVVRAVSTGAVDSGVLPVENLIVGPIDAARAAIAEEPRVAIAAETTVEIRLLLVAAPGVALADVRRVASHPAALGQCGRFLARHPEWAVVVAYDTAGAARDLTASGDRSGAAIASRAAAGRYGLVVLADEIADRADNWTRFVRIVRREALVDGAER